MQVTDDHFAECFSKFHNSLEMYCYRLVHYDPKYRTLAEDAVQIAFLKALQHPDQFAASPNQYGWLAICCKNHIRSKLRQQKHRCEIAGTHVSLDVCRSVEDPTDAIIRWMEASDSQHITDSIYASLTDKEKIVFKDYYERNCSLKETAKRNRLSDESVRGAIQRIRAKAKRLRILTFMILIGQCIFDILRTV